MLSALKCHKKPCTQTSASARVVDGKLILSFPDAVSPVLWQMDLAGSKASALEVIENAAKGVFTLALKTPKGETLDVAAFNTREEAMIAFMATSSALENAHGQIRGGHELVSSSVSYSHGAAPKKSCLKKMLIILGGLIVVAFLFLLWGASSPLPPASLTSAGTMANGEMAAPASGELPSAPQPRAGVPLSADEFLRSSQ